MKKVENAAIKKKILSNRRTSLKNFGDNRVLPELCDVSPTLDFLQLYGYERKICPEFRVKTKKKSLHQGWDSNFLRTGSKELQTSDRIYTVYMIKLNK